MHTCIVEAQYTGSYLTAVPKRSIVALFAQLNGISDGVLVLQATSSAF